MAFNWMVPKAQIGPDNSQMSKTHYTVKYMALHHSGESRRWGEAGVWALGLSGRLVASGVKTASSSGACLGISLYRSGSGTLAYASRPAGYASRSVPLGRRAPYAAGRRKASVRALTRRAALPAQPCHRQKAPAARPLQQASTGCSGRVRGRSY